MRFKILLSSLLAVLLIGSQAGAVSIKGRDVSSIPDILKQSRGLADKGSDNLDLSKASFIRIHDDGQLDLHYNIGNGDKYLSLREINGYSTTNLMRDNGIITVAAKTKFGNNKTFITSSKALSDSSHWFYDLNISKQYRRYYDGKFDREYVQLLFDNWRYGHYGFGDDSKSGYLKDIKTGIFVDGFDGELFVSATMEVTNDNPNKTVDFSTKKVSVRLDFWALRPYNSDSLTCEMVKDIATTQDGFEAAPLNGVKWGYISDVRTKPTTASPYIVMKTATGDFNNDGFENEVAVLTADVKQIVMRIYQINYDKESEKFSIKEMPNTYKVLRTYVEPDYVREWGYNGWNRIPGAELLTGDFDGDGKTELAAVFWGDPIPSARNNTIEGELFKAGNAVHLIANMYKWNNDTGKLDVYEKFNERYGMSYSYEPKFSGISRPYQSGYKRSLYMPLGGLKAVTLDIEGDGTDEIVFAWARSKLYEYVYNASYAHQYKNSTYATYEAWPCVSLIRWNKSNNSFNAPSDVYIGEDFINKRFGYDSFSYRNIIGGGLRDYQWTSNPMRGNPFGIQEFHIAPFSANEEIYPFIEREFALTAGPLYGTQGTVKARDDLVFRLSNGKMIIFKSNGSALTADKTLDAKGTSALVAADFADEGISLGKPTRIVRNGDRSYLAVIQAPPYHVDTVTVDGQSISPTPVNFSYVKGSNVKYSNKDTSSSSTNTKYDVSSTVETIFAIDSDLTKNVVGGYNTAKDIKGAIKNFAGIIPGTSAFTKALDGKTKAVTTFMEGIIDKTTKIKKGFDSELEEKSVFSTLTTERLDTVAYVQANQYIWRYPVVTRPAPDLGTMSSKAAFLTKQDFVTFMLYDDAVPRTGTPSEYQPIHENGNLFSYPTAVGNIENYNYKQKELTEKRNFQFGTTGEGTSVEFTKVKTNEKTESTKVETGYLSQALSLVDGLLGTDLAKVPAGENGPTYTRKQSKSEQIAVNLPNADSSPLLNGYDIQYQAYTADNGAITCGFAVNGLNRYMNLFNSQSIYSQHPDPSFVLPYKFSMVDSSKKLPDFTGNPNRQVAMEMRGVRFYALDFNRYTTGRLLGNAKYRIEIPLYNASFQPANNVRVDLYWVKDRTENALSSKQFIGTTYVSMKGWSDTGENRTWAKIDFTPDTSKIPANKAGEHYQLYAEIDSWGKITEVHEKRDLAKDPGGNNEGYFEFSVEDLNSAVASTAMLAQKIMSSAAGEDSIVMPEMTLNGKATWNDFYDEYIAGTDGPVDIDIVIVNKMPYTLPDTEFKITYTDGTNIDSAVYGKMFTLFPNETYKTSVVIDDDFADKLREVGKDATYGGYTMFWLDNLISEIYGDEDFTVDSEDHELEVLSADEYPEEDDTDKYVQSVITQTWTLSNDVPVFWRLKGVAELIDTSSSDVGTASISAATVTADDFTIIWNPEDTETNKTGEAELTASTIVGVTPRGRYAVVVEISEDGETWEEKEALEFDAESSSTNGGGTTLSSSSGGCNSGISALCFGILLSALMLRRKAR